MRGMLFTHDMAQAIWEGRKSQTRRVLKPQPKRITHNRYSGGFACDFGKFTIAGHCVSYAGTVVNEFVPHKIGDQLYVKEPHWAYGYWMATDELTKTNKQRRKFIQMGCVSFEKTNYMREGVNNMVGWYSRNNLFHAESDARSIITITDVRVQRLQDISEADAVAEGVLLRVNNHCGDLKDCYGPDGCPTDIARSCNDHGCWGVREVFADLINSIHGPDTWARNDWVAAYTFTRERIA